jgi:CHAT domain-containing protein
MTGHEVVDIPTACSFKWWAAECGDAIRSLGYAVIVATLLVFLLVSPPGAQAQQDADASMAMLELQESIKSAASAGDVTQLRAKIEQFKSMVEELAGKDSAEYAMAIIMTSMFDATENPQTALKQVKMALEKIDGNPAAPISVKAMGYCLLGSIYWRANQPRLAVASGQKALELSDQLPEVEALDIKPNILINLVAVELSRGDYEAAERYLRQLDLLAAGPTEESGDLREITIKSLKAQILGARGSFPEAEEAYLDCLKTLGAREDSEQGASTKGQLGDLYMGIGDYSRAEELYRNQTESLKQLHGEESSMYAAALEDLAWLLFNQGKLDEAQRIALRALELARRTGQGANKSLVAGLCYDLAGIKIKLGDLDAAQRYAEEAVEGGLDVDDSSAYGANLLLLARVLLDKGQFDKALQLNEKSSELAIERMGRESRMAVAALAQRGSIYRCMGEDEKARQVAAKLVPLKEKLFGKILAMDERSRLSWQAEELSTGFEACVLPDKDVADMILRRKGAVMDSILEDRTRARRFIGNKAASEQLREIARLQSRVAKLSFSTDPEDRKDAELLARKASNLEKSIAKAGASAGDSAGILALGSDDIRASLRADETAVVFFSFEDPKLPEAERHCYGAIILHGRTPVSIVHLQSASAIDRAIDGYRKALASGEEAGLERHLENLVSWVWLPISSQIPSDCVKLVVAPDGSLNFLSFAALPIGDDAFVADRFSVSYIASARDILRREEGGHEKTLAVFANPRFTFPEQEDSEKKITTRKLAGGIYETIRLPPLPGTEAEARMVREIATEEGWQAKVTEGAEASEKRVREVSSPGILHLATHGFYLKSNTAFSADSRGMSVVAGGDGPSKSTSQAAAVLDPMKASGVALSGAQATFASWAKGVAPEPQSDGVLTAEEIAALDLAETWLVVLSACETGVGEARAGEGVLGLRRAFMMSGAKNLLMTLWPVSDETTAEIMRDFYRKALSSGDAPSSLAKVQKDWLGRLRRERGLLAAVREAGPFAMIVMFRSSP